MSAQFSRPVVIAGLLLTTVPAATGCSRAKVKLKSRSAAPAPPAKVIVIPPRGGGLGLSELGEAAQLGSAGEALDQAASRLAEGAGKQTARLSEAAAAKVEGKTGGKLAGTALKLGTTLGGHAEKKRVWFEDAFSQAISGEARVQVVDPLIGLATVDCDYRLVFGDKEAEQAAGRLKQGVQQRGKVVKASGKLYGAALGSSRSKGVWRVEHCWDGETVAQGSMKFQRTFRWWMLDFFDRYKVRIDDDPIGAMATDFGATGAARAAHAKQVARIDKRRAEGAGAAPGSKLAGVTPAAAGSYASPVRADGSLAHWDNRVLVGDLAGAAVQEATKAGIQKVAGSGKMAKKAADLGGALAGGLTAGAITKKLPADHYFDDACSLAVWLDAAYAHRSDYREILRATTAVYTDLQEGFTPCLLQGS